MYVYKTLCQPAYDTAYGARQNLSDTLHFLSVKKWANWTVPRGKEAPKYRRPEAFTNPLFFCISYTCAKKSPILTSFTRETVQFGTVYNQPVDTVECYGFYYVSRVKPQTSTRPCKSTLGTQAQKWCPRAAPGQKFQKSA